MYFFYFVLFDAYFIINLSEWEIKKKKFNAIIWHFGQLNKIFQFGRIQ